MCERERDRQKWRQQGRERGEGRWVYEYCVRISQDGTGALLPKVPGEYFLKTITTLKFPYFQSRPHMLLEDLISITQNYSPRKSQLNSQLSTKTKAIKQIVQTDWNPQISFQ